MTLSDLAPQTLAFLQSYERTAPTIDYATISAPEMRAAFAIPSPPPRALPVEIADIALGALAARTYRPTSAGPHPITLYLHGGGFVLGNPATTDAICRELAHRAHSLVISIDYRLAPEAPFPAAFDDALAALVYIRDHARALGGRAPLAIAGDSSGGTIAAAAALAAKSRGIALCHQLLLYPPLDAACDTPSYRQFAHGHFLTAEMMRWYWQQYLSDPRDALDPRACPLRAQDLSDAPPTTITLAACDPLLDEGEAYARALAAAGITVEVQRWPGQIHGLYLLQGTLDTAGLALAAAGDALRRAFEST